MEVLSLIKHSLVSDNSNPITKHFHLGRQTASGGPEMVWKIYDATRIRDKAPSSVFVFEKKIADKIHKPKRRDVVSEILRKEVRILPTLKHHKILHVMHPLEECSDSLAFAVEPVFASLANLLGNHERLPAPVPNDIKDHAFLESEIKIGLLEITDAISYLHNTEHMLHLNICPSSVFVTYRGVWKLAGFGFAEKPSEVINLDVQHHQPHGQQQYPVTPWSSKHHKMAQPDMDFMAPEIQLETTSFATPSCDMYSFGMFICSLYNGGKSIIQASHTQANYTKQVDKMTELFEELTHRMPIELVEPVEKMINKDIRYRPTAQLFMLLKYFDDPVAQCMLHLDSIDTKDSLQKAEFFARLAQTIPRFPQKLLFNSVLPVLLDQLQHQDHLIFALPAMMSLISTASSDDYRTRIKPHFVKVLSMTKPIEATVYLLDTLDIVLAKSSEEDIKADVLPMIFNTLESNSIQGHEAAIGVFSIIRQYTDDQTIRKLVLPKAKALFAKSSNVQTKLNALACVDRLLDSLDKMTVLEEVLPFMTEITCSDVDIIMAQSAIYQHLLSDRKFGLTHNLLATKVMPTLIPHTVSPGLNIDQFNLLIDLLRAMLTQIDKQRRLKMISEAPDSNALELRSNLQQMHQAASRIPNIKLPEEYAMHSRAMIKRPSLSSNSNSSNGSSYFSKQNSRRCSADMRFSMYDQNRFEAPFGNKYMLTADEGYYNRYRRGSINRYGNRQAPSTPELQTKGSSRESLVQSPAYKKYSSFQGLGSEEQEVLDKIVRERRASLAPRSSGGTPHILVSEASLAAADHNDGWFFFGNPRRCSTQSMGPVVVPEPGRRDSRGKLLDSLQNEFRRSSFQGICESAMQFFSGK